MDRRTILGGLVTGGLLVTTSPALALVSDRYNTLVQLQLDLRAATTQARAILANTVTTTSDQRQGIVEAAGVHRIAEVLFDYMLREFNGSDLNDPRIFQTVQDLFHKRLVIDTLDEAQLRSIEDAVVVIAVGKNILAVEKTPLNANKTPSFETFAIKYRHLILG